MQQLLHRSDHVKAVVVGPSFSEFPSMQFRFFQLMFGGLKPPNTIKFLVRSNTTCNLET